MKKFDFRLHRVLQWRELQKQLQEERTRNAVQLAAEARDAASTLIEQGRAAAKQIQLGGEASVLASYPAFSRKLDQQKQEAVAQIQGLDAAVAKERKRLVEMHRNVELLTRLKEKQHTDWATENEREMQQFAEEAFIGRIQSKARARSSVG